MFGNEHGRSSDPVSGVFFKHEEIHPLLAVFEVSAKRADRSPNERSQVFGLGREVNRVKQTG